jgi:hypothetical protein
MANRDPATLPTVTSPSSESRTRNDRVAGPASIARTRQADGLDHALDSAGRGE